MLFYFVFVFALRMSDWFGWLAMGLGGADSGQSELRFRGSFI